MTLFEPKPPTVAAWTNEKSHSTMITVQASCFNPGQLEAIAGR